MSVDLGARRLRLGEVEAALARLRRRHDMAMSAFRFEEAAAPETGVVPALARPRRSIRR